MAEVGQPSQQRLRSGLNTAWEASPETIKTCVTWVNSNVTQPVLSTLGVQDTVAEKSDSLLTKADETVQACENHVARRVEDIKDLARSQIDFWLPSWDDVSMDLDDDAHIDSEEFAADQGEPEPILGVVKDRVRQRVAVGVDKVLPAARREQIYQSLLGNGLDRVLQTVESVTSNTEKTVAHVSHEVTEARTRARERLVAITEQVKDTISPYQERVSQAKEDVSAELKFRLHPVRVHGVMAGREIFRLLASAPWIRVPERCVKLMLFASGLKETDPDFQIAVDQVNEFFSAGIAFFRLSSAAQGDADLSSSSSSATKNSKAAPGDASLEKEDAMNQ